MANELRECNDKAFYAFGTAAIFTYRANQLRKKRMILVFFGIIGPVLVGGSVGAFGKESLLVSILIGLASIVTVLQLCFSTWALVSGWDSKFEQAIESSQTNNELFTEFEGLAKLNPPDIADKLKILLERNKIREAADMKAGITQDEKKYAMRASLLQFRQSCVGCGQTPVSIKPTKCDICGNFKELKL